ncbi:MAG: DUF4864 domain-containing protein [Candidatus Devosia phytovorans]|uniref:DUF4864 domain-containing protein n=1 Tax=Candidatus Devosia phytovorans TaxID=3121372 RepID=A0AAJ6B1I6_9HYPH|nr:DUF4864 domain-containing protein [Devosia sp.]WEK05394.1 MAG: DUF4864 domain-containing protein [Devosia sp.]
MRMILAVILMVLGLCAPALAQEEMPWQASVSGQIEAFRSGDGETALSFAGQAFRSQFDGQPEAFIVAIGAIGYTPIVESRSHGFGSFNRISDTMVMQVVKFVGRDQSLYEAIYQLADEPGEGWRVQGVVLRKEAGIGI